MYGLLISDDNLEYLVECINQMNVDMEYVIDTLNTYDPEQKRYFVIMEDSDEYVGVEDEQGNIVDVIEILPDEELILEGKDTWATYTAETFEALYEYDEDEVKSKFTRLEYA